MLNSCKKMNLNIKQPGPEKVDSILSFLHVPHEEIEGVPGEKALVSSIVYLLARQIPCTEHHLLLVLER